MRNLLILLAIFAIQSCVKAPSAPTLAPDASTAQLDLAMPATPTAIAADVTAAADVSAADAASPTD